MKMGQSCLVRPIVKIETSKGDIIIRLYSDLTPITVENFLGYVNDGFYNNTLIHRVIDGFIIQGGGFSPGFKAKKTREPIKNESNLGPKNIRGTIGLALTTDSNSGASQFYINVVDNPKLDFDTVKNKQGFTVFGEVIEGLKVVDKIRKIRTKQIQVFSEFYNRSVPIKDVPEEDIIIKSVTLLR
jgi:peptidyl-prolyl cis-trans isomerase B (cyclophilin B)